jgi:hypothetical protein
MKSNLITPMMALLLVSLLAVSAGTFVFAKRFQPGIDFDGPHHNLNIHGVPDGIDKFEDDTVGSGRHSIFIPLTNEDPITIQFSMSEELNWTVTDCDATGDGSASIILPRYMFVDTDNDPETPDEKLRVNSYKVYLVGLGKPGENEIVVSPRAEFSDSSGKVYYYWGDVTYEGHKNKKHGGADTGQPNWQNATDLFLVDTTLWIDADGDGVVDQEWNDANGDGIVDPGEWVDADDDGVIDNELITYEDEWVFNIEYLDGYWWDMQNSGVRLMQVRFYPVFNGK